MIAGASFSVSLLRIMRLLPLIVIALSCSNSLAQAGSDPTAWQAQLDTVEVNLQSTEIDEVQAANLHREVDALRVNINQCIADREAQIAQIESDLALIGDNPLEPEITEATENDLEDAEIQEQADTIHLRRMAMENDITQLRIGIQECRFLLIRTDRLIKNASKIQQQLSARRLSSQSGNLFSAIKITAEDPNYIAATSIGALVQGRDQIKFSGARALRVLGITIGALLLGFLLQHWLRNWAREQRGRGGEPTITTVLARNLEPGIPLILSSAVLCLLFYILSLPNAGDSILFTLALIALFYGLGKVTIRWLVGPYSPGANFLRTPELPVMVSRRLSLLLLALLFIYLLYKTGMFTSSPAQQFWLLRSVGVFLFVCSLMWVVILQRQIPHIRGKLVPLRFLILTACLVAVAADFAGYRNLANHLVRALVVTTGAGLLLWTLLWMIKTLLNGLVHGTSKFSYQVRSWMGMRPSESRSEFGWIRLILSFALWLGFAATLITAWDPRGNLLPQITDQIGQGIPIGQDKTLIPKDIFVGLLMFGALLAITAWVKARMSTRWLRDMGMDRGSREAMVTLSGYVGFMIALLSGLSLAGVDFKGLAIVLTALSVGIGFGLQNIVNNFVSGLILLFERPIKSGDYVSVGTVEGIIRQIRIRSTEIETLDRQTVIVPNSELVATQVTNWVLHDPYGRLTLNIGVAYGSDTERVREVLEETAMQHPEVLSKGPTPKPRALFVGFGDSSLDFELRAWIRQIEKRFRVTSDLNFAIDKAFRENDIEIPFPQRDLHVRSWTGDQNPDAEFDEQDQEQDQDQDQDKEPKPKPEAD